MQTIIDYFSTIPSSHRSLLLVSGIASFWLLESAVPLFRFRYHRWRHAGINFFFTFTTIVVNFALAFLLVMASDWAVSQQFGLLQLTPLPLWSMAILGLLAMDLVGAYLPHWVEHQVPILWRFHLVHHSDQQVDTTTANRHHPGESVIRFAFTTLGVLLLGAPMWLVFLYQSLSVVLSQFNHANISLPNALDRAIGWLLVTPNMHRVHHHYKLPYTDSNYGNIFSIWDRFFGTYRQADNKKLIYGIDTFMAEKEHSNVVEMLKIPFQPKRKASAPEDSL